MAKTRINLDAQGATGSVTNQILADGAVSEGKLASGAVTGAKIASGTIFQQHIGATAAIEYSKLALANSITGADIASNAGITHGQLSIAGALTSADLAANAGVTYGQLSISGSVMGSDLASNAGITYGQMSFSANIVDGDIAAAAAISDSKLAESYIKANGTRGFTGAVSMGGNKITSLAAGQNPTDAVNKAQLDAVTGVVNTFEWQPSVQGITGTPPAGATGDRYLISAAGATGAWAGKENQIAEYDGASWVFTTPLVGMFVGNDAEPDRLYLYGGASWDVKYFESTTASGGLQKVGHEVSVAPSLAGAGLTFGAGVLDITAGTGIVVNTDSVAVDVGTSANKIVQLNGSAQLPAVSGALLTNVDAVTLDGVDSASFLRSDASDSLVSGTTLTVDSGAVLDIVGAFKISGATMSMSAAQLNAVGSIVVRETPSGVVNGSNTDFTLAHTPMLGSEEVYLNGVLQDDDAGVTGANDYHMVGAVVQFNTAPATLTKVRTSYRY